MYTLEQKRYFARELARTGGNIAAATKALRDNYESLRNIGESTLRRFLAEPGAGELIAVEAARQSEIAAQVGADAERERMRQELMGSEFDRLARDEAILDDIRNLVKQALDEVRSGKDDSIPFNQLAAFYDRISRSSDARRQRTLPAIASTRDASILLRVIAEEAHAALGPKCQDFMKRIRERYVRESAAPAS